MADTILIAGYLISLYFCLKILYQYRGFFFFLARGLLLLKMLLYKTVGTFSMQLMNTKKKKKLKLYVKISVVAKIQH